MKTISMPLEEYDKDHIEAREDGIKEGRRRAEIEILTFLATGQHDRKLDQLGQSNPFRLIIEKINELKKTARIVVWRCPKCRALLDENAIDCINCNPPPVDERG